MSRFKLTKHALAVAPVKTGNPIIIGTPQVGQTLIATHGTYTGTVTGYSGQWYSGASPIALATSLSYAIVSGDLGNNITYQESASNAAGSSATGTSNALGPVTSGGGPTAITYDTRFGTDATTAAATGWFTFGLKSLCRRVWCDANKADDTGDGLSAATAKKTLMAAWTVFTNGSWTAGDQLMLAGTGGRSYTDDGSSVGWFNVATEPALGSAAATYPTAILCYDPAAPSDATKYGKLLGSDRPSVAINVGTIPVDHTLIFNTAANGALGDRGGFAVQGLVIDGQGIEDSGTGTQGKHSYICWQNCLFRHAGSGNNNADSPNGFSVCINYSKCAFYGIWHPSNGNASGLFNAEIDGLWVQDCIFVHCGWRMGATRDDQTVDGGPFFLGHGNYYTAQCNNGRFDRNVYIDSASDGWGIRGDATATQLVSIDEPIIGALTGYSGLYTEKPGGAIVTVTDATAFGGNDIGPNAYKGGQSMQRGQGVGGKNAKAGCGIDNMVVFDNPKYGTDGNWFFNLFSEYTAAINQSVALSRIRMHSFAPVAEIASNYNTGDSAKVSVTWSNSLLDTLTKIIEDGGLAPVTTSVTGTGVRVWTGGDYPTPLTKTDVITALGFASKQAMVNAMLDSPDLPWAQAVLGIVFPAFGATPVYQTASVPSLSGRPTPTVVYKTSLGTLTLSSLSFTRGTAAVAVVNGLAENSLVSSSDLPSGFTFDNFDLNGVTGNVTNGSNQITSVSNLTGVTKGMYVSAAVIGSVFPVRTYITGISGSTVTVSQNSNATGSSTIEFSGGGRALRYDGSGSGAATPTIHILETNNDGAGTHTTALTLAIS